MQPPYLRRAASADKGRAGKKHEASLAKRLGAQLTPGSGNLDGAKGDMVLKDGDFLTEAKTTTRDSYALKKSDLHKISGEAAATGRYPAFSVCFVNAEGQSKKTDRWIMIREEQFLELLENQRT